jgi:glycosyltransferase involved in cell wall biosynthesis
VEPALTISFPGPIVSASPASDWQAADVLTFRREIEARAGVAATEKPVFGDESASEPKHSKPSIRLAIVVSHPIQHFVSFYRALASRTDLRIRVFYASKIGVNAYYDHEMAATIRWAGDPLSGYESEFLPGSERITEAGFLSIDNPGVGRRLAEFKPDAVMVYGYAQLTQLLAFAWSRWRGIPILMTGDGDNLPRPRGPREAVRKFILRRFLRRIGAFLTVGDQNEAMLRGLGVTDERMFRAPLPIDEAVFTNFGVRRAEERARVRGMLGIAEDTIVLLYAGKLTHRKRPLDLVEAWARLASSGKIALLYCGDGPAISDLKRSIEATGAPAHLVGFVNVDLLPGYYCAADILVHPSERDPHPLICSEAACIGLPMILSDRIGAIGPTDIARDGQNAIVYRCGDIDALGAAMARLSEDAALRRKMSQSSHAIYVEYSMSVTVEGLMRALRTVVGVSRLANSRFQGF